MTVYSSAAATGSAAGFSPAAALSAGSASAGTFTVPAGAPVAGVSFGHRELAEADHWILALTPAPVLACTHLVRTPFPHVAISLVGAAEGFSPAGLDSPDGPSSPDQPVSPDRLREAAQLAAAGKSGRAVVFPGVQHLVGTLTVAEVLAVSAIDEVRVLGGDIPDPATLLATGDFVRPQYQAGRLILTAMPAAGGRLVPFESRNPTPCCAAH